MCNFQLSLARLCLKLSALWLRWVGALMEESGLYYLIVWIVGIWIFQLPQCSWTLTSNITSTIYTIFSWASHPLLSFVASKHHSSCIHNLQPRKEGMPSGRMMKPVASLISSLRGKQRWASQGAFQQVFLLRLHTTSHLIRTLQLSIPNIKPYIATCVCSAILIMSHWQLKRWYWAIEGYRNGSGHGASPMVQIFTTHQKPAWLGINSYQQVLVYVLV